MSSSNHAAGELEASLKELFEQYSNSSTHAFQKIYTLLSPKVMTYLRKRLQRDEDIAEVYQGFFLKLHRSRNLYNPANPILPWIYSVLRTQMLDHIKKDKRHHRKLEALFQEQLSQKPELPSLDVSKGSFAEIIQKLGLKEEAISLLVMKFEEELSTAQMAQKLGINEATLRKRMSRLMAELKEKVEA